MLVVRGVFNETGLFSYIAYMRQDDLNRLIGDSALPPEKRRTNTNVRFFSADAKYRAFEGFSPKDALAPSGLIGPVRLEFGKEVDVAF